MLTFDVSIFSADPPKLKTRTTDPQWPDHGDTQTLLCTFTGWPTPKITWYKDNATITDADSKEGITLMRKKGNKVTTEMNLKIQSAPKKQHDGVYTCSATNEMGSGRYYLKVNWDNPVCKNIRLCCCLFYLPLGTYIGS